MAMSGNWNWKTRAAAAALLISGYWLVSHSVSHPTSSRANGPAPR
jgi:predicted acyltransferase